jgi:hypothetical protein
VALAVMATKNGPICGDGRIISLDAAAPLDSKTERDALGDLVLCSHLNLPFGPILDFEGDPELGW